MELGSIYVEDKLDNDDELYIKVTEEDSWLDRDAAIQLIDHIERVFEL